MRLSGMSLGGDNRRGSTSSVVGPGFGSTAGE